MCHDESSRGITKQLRCMSITTVAMSPPRIFVRLYKFLAKLLSDVLWMQSPHPLEFLPSISPTPSPFSLYIACFGSGTNGMTGRKPAKQLWEPICAVPLSRVRGGGRRNRMPERNRAWLDRNNTLFRREAFSTLNGRNNGTRHKTSTRPFLMIKMTEEDARLIHEAQP
jgi:hypothetical protein